jgi:hypothetical protein
VQGAGVSFGEEGKRLRAEAGSGVLVLVLGSWGRGWVQ